MRKPRVYRTKKRNHRPPYRTPKFPFPIVIDERKLLHEFSWFARKLPVVGPWLSRAAHVTKIVNSPCSPTKYLFVKSAWVAAPRLIYLVVKPFRLAEVAYRFLDAHCGKKPKGILKRIAKAIEVAEEGNPLFDIEGPHKWAVFQIAADFSLKFEWYLMIADRATEGFNNWVSLPYQWSGCHIPGDPYWYGETSNQINLSAGGQVGFFQLEWDHVINSPVGPAVPPGFGVTASFHAQVDQPYRYGLFNNGVEVNGDQTTRGRNKDGSYTTQNMSMYDGDPTVDGSVWSVRCMDPTPVTAHGKIMLWVSGTYVGNAGMNFDP